MTQKIEGKIVKYRVSTADEGVKNPPQGAPVVQSDIVQMSENLERPDLLMGSTYKIKTPHSEHALYVTINDILLNPGTDYEHRRPFEIFINSKNMDHFQWVVALTRLISAVFRKGGDVTFMVEELKAVFDPQGGYFKRGGRYMPSLVAEIGDAIESHMKLIGLLQTEEMDANTQALIQEKRAACEGRAASQSDVQQTGQNSDFPPEAQLCSKCMTKALMNMDGCLTCLNCGDSKCQ
jgi:hypothetical protein